MNKFHKSYRIRTEVGKDTQVHVNLDRDYDVLEIMSLKINQENAYKFHTSNYGVIAGRVLANDAFGVPNAKVSVFIPIDGDDQTDVIKTVLYPYNNTKSQNEDGVRYNLLLNEQINDCHTIIGTFPEKQYLLDNDSVLEIFEKYYKFTTRTNNSGDYMIFGVPVGNQTIHVDIDLSDIGILSQKPRDMFYKGYNVESFENPNKFKHDTNLDSLVQVITQDNVTNVIPFWGDESEGSIGITRCDINIQYKFEPTCIFMGSVVADAHSEGISKKCIPTPGMGSMEEIVTGSGTIEMIRKTPSGDVEEFQIKGNQLINGNGVWCYQIPMNLDYMMTDEFGNMVPTNHPEKGIPTRTRVRFRISLQDFDNDNTNIALGKVLVPHNPDIYSANYLDELDYNFGTKTNENSYRDLFWNGVYSVKSYIPRIQKGSNWKNEKFTGFKRVNYYGSKNPIPYNNIRIRLPFAFTIMCILIKLFIRIASVLNWLFRLCSASFFQVKDEDKGENKKSGAFISISGELCNENLDYLCIIPGINISKIINKGRKRRITLLGNAILKHFSDLGGSTEVTGIETDDNNGIEDSKSIDYSNKEDIQTKHQENGLLFNETGNVVDSVIEDTDGSGRGKGYDMRIYGIRVTDKLDYLIQCIEIKLAQEYKVIQFDFYNDWVNGLIYIPRWMRTITKKHTYLWGLIKIGGKVKACNDVRPNKRINLVQQCGLSYSNNSQSNMEVVNPIGCKSSRGDNEKLYCHKATEVRKTFRIFNNSGLVHTFQNMNNQYVYYFKPIDDGNKCVRLFATDIILLGTLNNCDKWGIPNDLTQLVSSTYQMPPNLALTDSDLEGNDYEASLDNTKFIRMTVVPGKAKVTSLNIGGCYVGLNPFEEDGNYTELSGVDWGYSGPLQTLKSNESATKMYSPGGHFLGISCRNAATSIKSCVNLNRICEYGVWMSQRHELMIPDTSTPSGNKSNAFLNYATVPTGFISKDEISDTNYRRLFASLNKNKLRVKTNLQTGYPIYDFEYVNPTNFSGELRNRINNDSKFNRFITEVKTEHYYEYDEDYYYRKNKQTVNLTKSEYENEIMRTGEFADTEYLKYRFGLHDSDFTNNIVNTSAREKRFLLKDSSGNLSFPMYDNSFYFYFGLVSGNTALDEFKKTYYANCDKIDLFDQAKASVSLSGLTSKYDGFSDSDIGTGQILFSQIITTDDYFTNGNYLNIDLYDADDNFIKNYKAVKSDAYTFTNIRAGEYVIKISNEDGSIYKEYPITVGRISFKALATGVPFSKDVSKWNSTGKFGNYDNREELGGYIYLDNNCIEYKKSDSEVVYFNIFESYVITDYVIRNEEGTIEIKGNGYNVTYDGITKTLTKDSAGNYMIPVPKENTKYYIEIYGYHNQNKPVENKYYLYNTRLFVTSNSVDVYNGTALLFTYNNISYEQFMPYVGDENELSTEGWWSVSSNDNTQYPRLKWDKEFADISRWDIKTALYMGGNVVDTNKAQVNPHSVKIDYLGGTPPYTIKITGEDNNGDKTDGWDNLSPLETITMPTINYRKNEKRRSNFTFQLIDKLGQQAPTDKPFIIPVIYKPFFTEMLLCNYDDQGVYLCGNIYNGKTWKESEGFNNCFFNGQKMQSFTTDIPDTVMEINEVDDDGVKISGGGLGYEGTLSKYNARKITISRSLNALDIYNINTNGNAAICEFNVGSSHNNGGVLYEDSTSVKNTDICLFKFELESILISGKYSFRMKPTTSYSDKYDFFAIIDSDENIKGHYPYPFDNVKGVPTITNTKLFKNILTDKVESVFMKKNTPAKENPYIMFDDERLNGKNVYYVMVPTVKNDECIESSNEHSVLKAVTISRLIHVDSIQEFYPLNLTYNQDLCADVLKLNGTFKTTVVLQAEDDKSYKNIPGKYFTIRFYKNETDIIPSLTKTVQPNGDNELVMNLTGDDRIKIGLTNDSTTTTSSMLFYFDYDATIISSNITSPTTYGRKKLVIKFIKES